MMCSSPQQTFTVPKSYHILLKIHFFPWSKAKKTPQNWILHCRKPVLSKAVPFQYKLISDCHKQGGKSLSIFSLHCLFPHTIKVLTSFHLAFNSAATTFELFLERLVKITPDFIKFKNKLWQNRAERGEGNEATKKLHFFPQVTVDKA